MILLQNLNDKVRASDITLQYAKSSVRWNGCCFPFLAKRMFLLEQPRNMGSQSS